MTAPLGILLGPVGILLAPVRTLLDPLGTLLELLGTLLELLGTLLELLVVFVGPLGIFTGPLTVFPDPLVALVGMLGLLPDMLVTFPELFGGGDNVRFLSGGVAANFAFSPLTRSCFGEGGLTVIFLSRTRSGEKFALLAGGEGCRSLSEGSYLFLLPLSAALFKSVNLISLWALKPLWVSDCCGGGGGIGGSRGTLLLCCDFGALGVVFCG